MGPAEQRRVVAREMRRTAESMFVEAAYVVSPWKHNLEAHPDDMLRAVGRLRATIDELERATVRFARTPVDDLARPISWARIGRALRGWASRDAARKMWADDVADLVLPRRRRR